MLLLKSIGLCFFGCDICFNLVLIGIMIVIFHPPIAILP